MVIPNEIQNKIKNSNKTPKEIKTIEYDSMGDDTIKHYFPNAKIITYPELKNYNSIDDLIPKHGDYCFLLYLQQPNSGHWTLLLNDNGIIEFFCSYGSNPSEPLKWSENVNSQLGQTIPYLDILLSKTKKPVKCNSIDYQNNRNYAIATCGRHDCFFLLCYFKYNMDLDKYYTMMKAIKDKFKMNYDEIVSENISKL